MTKSKKVVISLVAVLAVVLVPLVVIFASPKSEHYKNHDKYRQLFGIMRFETLNHVASEEEKTQSTELFEEVKNALSYAGKEADFNFPEPYKKFYNSTMAEMGYSTVVVEADFITFVKIGNTGYLWFEYSEKYFNANGESGSASGGVLTLVKAKLDNGIWNATEVLTVP